MIDALRRSLRRWQPDPLRRRVEESIRNGTGFSRGEWLLDGALDEADLDQLAAEMVAWCRERIASARRPYGIDQLSLAVACAEPGRQPFASTTFGVFRPLEFYADGGVAERLRQFVSSLRITDLNRRGAEVRVAAALFSWGDVARATIFADE
ncbi:MAG: hypothetical protein GEU80_05370 [Dehalococcoidia bacterium]|nr:hypothetical protein [Dehalococcoidia bacterium]